jgi:NADP-dependent 3-hydroxy acid dehydrogenase YdfG
MILLQKIAVVTGASSGLGAAIAEALCEKKVVVFGLARSRDKLASLHKKCGDHFRPVCIDITDEQAVQQWVKQTFSADFLPDILINNAGFGEFGKMDEMSSKTWLQMIQVNLNGTYFMTASLIPWLKKNIKHSHIINIGSVLGSMGKEEGSAYCASKFAVSGLSESLFKELRYDNIKVSLVNPGSIETDFLHTSGVEAHENMLQASDLADTIIHLLETPANLLISEITIRPLNPRKPY